MAEKPEQELDVEAAQAGARRSVPWLKVVIIVLVVTLLLGATALATLYFSGALGAAAGDSPQAAKTEGPAPKKAAKPQSGKPKSPLKYLALDPAFLVNFDGGSGPRFLQVTMQIGARDQAVLDAVKSQMPAVRNALVLLLSSQKPAELKTRTGKQKLRHEILAEVNKTLKKETGKAGVEGVYFTSFVMQ